MGVGKRVSGLPTRERRAAGRTPGGESGMSVVEVLVATTLALLVALIAYAFIDYTRRSYVAENELTTARSTGRAILDIVTGDLRMAGYSPLGVVYAAIPSGTPTRLRMLADLNGNALVGTAGENDENLTYVFADADGDGVFTLSRGLDLNGDGDFSDPGESVHVVSDRIVQVDRNRDGTLEPFLAYDQAPPTTTEVQLTFGVRTARRDSMRKAFPVVPFDSAVVLRNREGGKL